MADGASRIFNIINKSGTDTISEFLTLSVKSLNPLTLTDGDKLFLTEEFLYFDTYINKSKIRLGDKFIATTYNSGQTFYIYDIVQSSQNLDNYITEINTLKNTINSLQRQITDLDRRVTALENS